MALDIQDLEIDEANEREFSRHGVTVRELFQLLDGPIAVFRNRRHSSRAAPDGSNARWPHTDGADRSDRRRGAMAPGDRVAFIGRRESEVRAGMTDPGQLRTDNPDDLEPEEVRPRANRGVVVSVRLSATEAATVAERAARAGLSVSQFTRQALEQATTTPWRIMVWNARTPQVIERPPETGGDYGRRLGDAADALAPSG